METGYLKHVKIVFERLGFIVSSGDLDWDVMWAHDYPFTSMAKIITALKPHQRVCHSAGSQGTAVHLNLFITQFIMSPQPKGRGDILLLVRILSASALLLVCTLSTEPIGGF